MKKRTVSSLLIALMFVLALAPAALARVPDRPDNNYVLDEARVLTDSTEKHIVAGNRELFESCGAEIVVAAVDFLDGEDIRDYTNDMFNSWGVGSEERNNGLLLVLAIGEENYFVQAGYGFDDYFDYSLLSEILDEYLEPDFAAGDYDAGVRKTFDALSDEVEGYYRSGPGADDPMPDYEDEYWEEDQDFGSPFRALKTIAIAIVRVVVVVALILFVFSLFRGHGGSGPRGGGGGGGFWRGMMLGSMMGGRRRNYWGPPPPPPPPGPRPGGFGGPRPGGFGGFGGSHGGFSGGGRSHGGGAGRGGFGGGFHGGGGGFHGGGGSHGGGAGRR